MTTWCSIGSRDVEVVGADSYGLMESTAERVGGFAIGGILTTPLSVGSLTWFGVGISDC
jgi:hypothetical protein